MKKMKRILSLCLIILIVLSFFTACGLSKKESSQSAAPNYTGGAANNEGKGEAKQNAVMDKAGSPAPGAEIISTTSAIIGTGAATEQASNAILSQRKIIRNANVTVEVEDFDVSYGKIKSMISGFGFVQESNIKKDKVYIDGKEKLITRGIITIRVDKDKFERVLSDVKGLGLLLDENIKSDDVTDKFFDTESSLRLLKFEQNRLEQYLLKATDVDTIFKTESRLTQIRQDIERLTGTLQKWNDLVELSTIRINMNEKVPGAGSQLSKDKSYFDKLSSSFVSSFKGVIEFCGDLLIFIVQALPVLVFLGFIVFVAFKVYKKFFKEKFKDSTKKDNDTGI